MRAILWGLIGIASSAGCASTIELELVTLSPATIVAAQRADAPVVAVVVPVAPVVVPVVSRARVEGSTIALNEKIQFTAQSAKLAPASYAVLDDVAKLLNARPDITRVEIRGHTAHMGRAKRSYKLSIERAASVRDYLIKKGIAERRLIAKGLGASVPVADNSSEVGREQNRRVELLIRSSPKNSQTDEVALAEGAKQ